MSKSLGNSFFIKDALKTYDGEILRNYLLGVHYRLALNFNEEDLLQSKKRLDKIYRLKKRIESAHPNTEGNHTEDLSHLSRLKTITKDADKAFLHSLIGALSDDYNISKALSIIEDMLSHSNDMLDKNPKDKAQKQIIRANLACVEFLLGLGGKVAQSYFQLGLDEATKAHIESQIAKRLEAKKAKDYALADTIRDELKNQGIEIMDTPSGCIWEKV